MIDPPDLSHRTIDDRYVLRKRLGEGAFGVVYRAEQLILGKPVRRVAVKLSHRGGLDVETVRDQIEEALLLARAMDEMTDAAARGHLVQVYDGGLAADLGGRGYLAMEYVPGTTLAHQFQSYKRGVPAPLMTRWAREICVALRALHSLVPALVHRDLKPDNVLLGLDRAVRLVDFGLAGRLVERGYLEGIAGTLRYTAPETLRGESVPASDVYALGVLMYEGLTGRTPYHRLVPPPGMPDHLHGEWLIDARRGLRVDRPSEVNNTVPAGLDRIIMRCLEDDPVLRPASAAELMDLLDEPPPAAPESPLEEARRLRRQGDTAGAVRVLEDTLGTPPGEPAARLAVLSTLGEVLGERGDWAEAARRYADAWQVSRQHPALLRERRERAELAGRAADAFDRAGNSYQARRYEQLRDREPGAGG